MIEKLAQTSVEIHELLARRWSLRAFDITRQVSDEQILSICEAGRWAPSCYGDEPWRFVVWDIFQNKEAYLEAFDCIGEWNQRWVRTAPVLMASFADDRFRKNLEPNRWSEHDTGLATQNILLQAFALGLGAHPFGGFDGEKLKIKFKIDSRFTPMSMIAIGYRTSHEILDEEHAANEIKPRFRRPLGDTFFINKWENPIK